MLHRKFHFFANEYTAEFKLEMNRPKILREDVVKAEEKLFSAQIISDVKALDELLFDHLIAVIPGGGIVTKEMDLNSHKAKTMIIEDATTEIDEIVITGQMAIAVVTMTAKGKLMGTPLEGKFRYFRVWQIVGDNLKVVGASIMQIA